MHHAIDRVTGVAHFWLACAQLAADTQSVMTMRLLGLGGAWAVSPDETSRMVDEKLPAFTESLVAGTLTALSGHAPDLVMRAVIDPLSRAARSNRLRLAENGPSRFAAPLSEPPGTDRPAGGV